ncbi:MAG TPA: UvrD-helicase domain-containing protein [archaeon]|nr:UvrD-helicase domain-containing protein [archaeon]
MQYIADLHLHSHYSIATSKNSDPEHLFEAAALKGINLVGTGDLTHPGWRRELEEKLVEEEGSGLFCLRPGIEKSVRQRLPGTVRNTKVRFLLSGEISSIYKKLGKARKVHNLVLMPDMESARRLSESLERIGNIRSDGRPILGLDSRNLLEICLEACPEACFIPAHIWTPHFSVFGSKSGFDRIEDCYGELTEKIYAVETGLSSDPPMNWRLSALDNFRLVSNSDAHSPDKLGREANLFDTELSYHGLTGALKERNGSRFQGTLEFYPEEGKYHYDGHRACKVRLTPEETARLDGRCPVCGGKVTRGVLNRVVQLADRPLGTRPETARHFEHLIPLREVLAESYGTGPATKGVTHSLEILLREVGPELFVLREAPLEEVSRAAGALAAEAIRRNREGRVRIAPGYDGEYGTVCIFEPGERETSGGQMFFFDRLEPEKKTQPEKGESKASPQAQDAATKSATGVLSSVETEKPGEALLPVTDKKFPELNERQLEAVTAEKGPLAVIAGPGTGKTHCLTSRAVYLVRQAGVPPSNILAVTFTNKAAREMKERLFKLLGTGDEDSGAVHVSTFHSFCLRLLTEIKGAPVVVVDEAESLSILREAVGLREPVSRLRQIAEAISRAKAEAISPENYHGPEDIRRAFTAYRDMCHRMKACDYDDLILHVLEILAEDPERLQTLREHYPYVLVDEFQDVNPAQYELVKLLAGSPAEGLFVIGDPNQSIYGFRGSDHRIFERLKSDYPGLRLVTLELGYRCRQVITEASGSLIGKSPVPGAVPRPLVPGGPLIRLLRCPSELSEGIAVVHEIGRLVGGIEMLSAGGGRRPRQNEDDDLESFYSFADCAVITRTGGLCEGLEEAFITEGIPYRLRGSKSFLKDPAVRQLVSFIRLAVNPQDDLRFTGALRLAGLKPEDQYFTSLKEAADRSGRALLSELKFRLSREVPLSRESKRAAEFLLAYEKYRRRTGQTPAGLLGALVEEFIPDPGGSAEHVSALLRTAEQFDDLTEFLNRLTVQAHGDIERAGQKFPRAASEAVTLMTMHASKGLEFKVVFITGAEEGLIPFTYRETDLQEERRLFYVALTRASERLYLTSAANRMVRGKPVKSSWSPFLQDIPARLLKQEEAVRHKPSDRQLKLL